MYPSNQRLDHVWNTGNVVLNRILLFVLHWHLVGDSFEQCSVVNVAQAFLDVPNE